MTRQTRKAGTKPQHGAKTQSGGQKLGAGGHATAYNMGCGQGESLCEIMKTSTIKKIVLYHVDGANVILTNKKDIAAFQQFSEDAANDIAKIFNKAALFSKKTTKEDFEEEIHINKKILYVFGTHAEEYLTLGPVKGFRKLNLVGAHIEFENGAHTYAALGLKCGPMKDIDLDKFIVDMLQTIQILQGMSFEHNDIKLDNILHCDGRYKLLDWGQSDGISFTQMKMGTLLATSPMRWYIHGYNEMISDSIITYKTKRKYNAFYKSDMFKATTDRISEEFHTVLSVQPDRVALRSKYLYSFDVFMLGMTILHAVFKYKLDYVKYKPIIDKFTSLIDPVHNAFAALEFVVSVSH